MSPGARQLSGKTFAERITAEGSRRCGIVIFSGPLEGLVGRDRQGLLVKIGPVIGQVGSAAEGGG
jgi:hypothetical protein